MRLHITSVALLFAGLAFGQAPTIGGCPSFPANSIWNAAIDTLPLDSHSAAYIASISASTGLRHDVSMPINFVSGTQPKVPINLTNPDESDPGPYPIPPDALVEDGSDRHVLVVDQGSCMLYETFYSFLQPDGSWTVDSSAKWSLTSNGLRPEGWTSADAAGLPITPGLLRYDEMTSGHINHALRFTAPRTQRLFIWPARHFASQNFSAALPPMGQRFRLKASFDISGFSPNMQTVLRAIKKYGLILADNGLPWFLQGQSDSRWDEDELDSLRSVLGSNLEAVDVSGLMIDPDSGQAAQSGGATVTVSPASVTLSAAQSQQFTATVSGISLGVVWSMSPLVGNLTATGFYTAPALVSATQTVTITATLADGSKSGFATVTVQPGAVPALSSILITPLSVVGGSPVNVTVNLTAPALAGGAAVSLTGSNPAFPSTSVTVSSGLSFQTFAVPTSVVTTVTSVTITAAFSGASVSSLPLTVNPGSGATNLALGKAATQSSTLAGYLSTGASSAIDGNPDGNFFHGSVTHTNVDVNPWWQVDLGAPATVNSIAIWNRTDCCSNRLNDYWVFVSNAPFSPAETPSTLQNRAGTWSSHQTTAPNPSTTIAVGGVSGRYVRVQLTGANNLSLAEVQVMGTGGSETSNLALGKTAAQSSTLPGYVTAGAGGAADGSTDGNFFNGSVTHTNLEANPWWQVDLGTSATVNSIAIWNRTDCCGNRLSDYWVFVSDTPFGANDTPSTLQGRGGTWSSHQTTVPNPSAVIVSGAQGRYVRVQLAGVNNLSLAEVQVLGIPLNSSGSNVALGKTASQSSTLPGYATTAAAAAVDGSTDGNFFNGSVTHTDLDINAWWQVDLGASTAIGSIVIWNRTDCCGTRLNDYWVFASDTPFGPGDSPSTLQNRAGTFGSHQTTAPNPSTAITAGTQGRYVRVQLNGTNNLSLAEVQVIAQ